MDLSYVTDAPRVGAVASASAAFATIALHTVLFGCCCGCFKPTRHAILLFAPTLCAASAWYGVVTATIAFGTIEDAAIAVHDKLADVVHHANAVGACFQGVTPQELADVDEQTKSAQNMATTALDVIVAAREPVEFGLNGIAGFVTVLFATTSLVRYALPVFPLVICSGAPALLSGIVGTAFVFAHGALFSICDTLLEKLEENDAFNELVSGERGSISAAMDAIEKNAAAANLGAECTARLAELTKSVAPGVLRDTHTTVNDALCNTFGQSLLYIGVSFVGAACAPFLADVIGIFFRATDSAKALAGYRAV